MLFERTKKEPTAGSEAIGENIAALRKERPSQNGKAAKAARIFRFCPPSQSFLA